MARRRVLLALTAAGLASLGWIMSCVNDSTNGIPPGEDGGPCLSNNTCDEGLVCGVVNGAARCLPVGVDAASDGESKDAQPSGDAGDAGDAVSDAVSCGDVDTTFDFAAHRVCYLNPQNTSEVACFSEQDASVACANSGSCGPNAYFQAGCLGEATTFICCLIGSTWLDGGCIQTLNLPDGSFSLEQPKCLSGVALCDDASICIAHEAGTKCAPVALSGPPSLDGVITGVCQ